VLDPNQDNTGHLRRVQGKKEAPPPYLISPQRDLLRDSGPPPANIAAFPTSSIKQMSVGIMRTVRKQDHSTNKQKKKSPDCDPEQCNSQRSALVKQLKAFNRTRCPVTGSALSVADLNLDETSGPNYGDILDIPRSRCASSIPANRSPALGTSNCPAASHDGRRERSSGQARHVQREVAQCLTPPGELGNM